MLKTFGKAEFSENKTAFKSGIQQLVHLFLHKLLSFCKFIKFLTTLFTSLNIVAWKFPCIFN